MRLLRFVCVSLFVVCVAPGVAMGQGEPPMINEPLTPRPAIECRDDCRPDRRARVALTIGCPADASFACKGDVWIAKGRRAQFAVEPGESASVKAELDRGLRKRLDRRRTLKTHVHVWAYGGWHALELTERVTLRARRGG